jgi:hypothetical protein
VAGLATCVDCWARERAGSSARRKVAERDRLRLLKWASSRPELGGQLGQDNQGDTVRASLAPVEIEETQSAESSEAQRNSVVRRGSPLSGHCEPPRGGARGGNLKGSDPAGLCPSTRPLTQGRLGGARESRRRWKAMQKHMQVHCKCGGTWSYAATRSSRARARR